MDAVHPQHNTRSTYAWVKKGQDKAVPTNSGRRPININGAMNAHRPEEVIIVEADRINAQATIELYDKVQPQNPDKDTIYVVGDNAVLPLSQPDSLFVENAALSPAWGVLAAGADTARHCGAVGGEEVGGSGGRKLFQTKILAAAKNATFAATGWPRLKFGFGIHHFSFIIHHYQE